MHGPLMAPRGSRRSHDIPGGHRLSGGNVDLVEIREARSGAVHVDGDAPDPGDGPGKCDDPRRRRPHHSPTVHADVHPPVARITPDGSEAGVDSPSRRWKPARQGETGRGDDHGHLQRVDVSPYGIGPKARRGSRRTVAGLREGPR